MSRVLSSRYALEEPLGGGGTAVVWRARDAQTGGRVAIKQLRPQYARDRAVAARFLREAAAVRRLRHPGIVEVLDAGDDDGPFLVMELVEGETLRALLDRIGALPASAVRTIAAAIGRALDHAHAHGVIHRDLKPENVILAGPPAADATALTSGDLASRVKLADFGQARVTSTASLTGVSLAWGSPEYMAPEVFARGRLDPRSDLYSFGVLLHEMLVGRRPWTRAEALARLGPGGSEAHPRLPATAAGAGTDALIRDLLARAPSDRPESAAAVLARLAAPLAAPAVVGRPVCGGCGAAVGEDLPACAACGCPVERFAHAPLARWRLVLRRIDDDAAAVGKLMELVGTIAHPPHRPVELLLGPSGAYTNEEWGRGIALPAVLFSELDEETARGLERLFRQRGLDVEARLGAGYLARARPPVRPTVAMALTIFPAAMISGFVNLTYAPLQAMAAAAVWIGASVGALRWLSSRRVRAGTGVFTLRGTAASVPLADAALGEVAAALAKVRSPEVRTLAADVAAAIYRLARRAEAGSARSGSSGALAERLLRAAPEVGRRLVDTAARLDAIDAELGAAAESETVQALARLERRAAAAADPTLIEARRSLERVHARRLALEQDRDRLSASLCALLGRLRESYRAAENLLARGEEDALALEEAAAELDRLLVAAPRPEGAHTAERRTMR